MRLDFLPVRPYSPETDAATLEEWHRVHERAPWLPQFLPPLGVVVEDEDGKLLGACWLHLSVGLGLGFLESPVSRPGLSLSEAAAVFRFALGALVTAARVHNYNVLVAHTLPGIARFLKSCGFVDGDPKLKKTLTLQL